MKATTTRTDRERHQTIRKIQKKTHTLSGAIEIYNFLTEYGTKEITAEDKKVWSL